MIRKQFPDSPIIRIVRDPRDVALSLLKTPWGPTNLVGGLNIWLKYDRDSNKFFEQDQKSLTLRYEDLLTAPEMHARKICEFIDEPFDPNMLSRGEVHSHVNRIGEPWKKKAGGPIDVSRIDAWKTELSSEQNRLMESIAGHRIRDFGYSLRNDFAGYCEVFPRIDPTEEDVFLQLPDTDSASGGSRQSIVLV